MDESLRPFANQIVVFSVCGDAEAWVFDIDAIGAEERAALVATHLKAFAEQLRRRGSDLLGEYEPFALLGNSMPAAALGVVDLGAPHEGTLLRKKKNGAIFYVAAADDVRGYFVADDATTLGFREAGQKPRGAVTYGGTPTMRTGFTLEQYAIGGNALAWTMSKHTGVIGLFERMFGKG